MTWQVKDTLKFHNKTYDLNVTLLEKYFREFRNKIPKVDVIDTACWRGHIVNFEILNKELLINKIVFLGENGENIGENFTLENFSNRKFEWFSGFIRIDNFKGDYDEEKDRNAIFEYLEIKYGNLINHWELNWDEHREFKFMLLSEFKELQEFKILFHDIQKDNNKMKYIEIENKIFEQIISLANDNYLKLGKNNNYS
jgi:hypothetical protein